MSVSYSNLTNSNQQQQGNRMEKHNPYIVLEGRESGYMRGEGMKKMNNSWKVEIV